MLRLISPRYSQEDIFFRSVEEFYTYCQEVFPDDPVPVLRRGTREDGTVVWREGEEIVLIEE